MQSHFFSVAVTLLLTSLGLNVLADPDVNLYYSTLGQRTFAVNLFKATAEISRDNFAVSTRDVFLGLLRVYFGSEGRTKRCLENVLGIYSTDGYLSSSHEYASMVDQLEEENNLITSFSNGMAYRDTYILKSDYDETILNVYPNFAPSIRFEGIDDFLGSLASWYLSRYLFPEFQRNQFSGAENIILFGGGYFIHEWQQAAGCVYKSTYYSNAQRSESDVTYTHMLGNFSYGELPDLSASYIAIPWSPNPGGVILYLILPNAKDGLSELEYGIMPDTIEKMIYEAKKREVHVSVPKIYIDSQLHLQSILANKLHMYEVFDDGNLSGMAEPDPEIVNEVLNAVTIEAFDDNGPYCPGNSPPNDEMHSDRPYFNADHPFLAVIVSKGGNVKGKESLIIGMARHKLPTNRPKANK